MHSPTRNLAVGLLAILAAGCQSTTPSDNGKIAAYDDLGSTHRAIRTSSPEAQRAFDQGLILMWGFNHDEAIAAPRVGSSLRRFDARGLARPPFGRRCRHLVR